jgi:hypothetical protein
MAVEIRTGRGLYRIISAAAALADTDGIVVTLALERTDGIERVVFRCRVSHALLDTPNPETEAIILRISLWIEREFEVTREAALKSIRTDRKLLEVVFDRAHPGPF